MAARIGAIGVVLVRDRRAEDGEDAVAEDLVDTPTELVDVALQPLEGTVDEALDAFGVEVLAEGGVADDVGEEDRDHPTLLGERAEDLVPAERAEPCTVGQRP